jgi:ribosomal protein S18 acetylase RimI-like enzyme
MPLITIDRINVNDLIELSNLYEELSGAKTDMVKMKENFNLINSNADYILIGAKDENNTLVGSLLGIICRDVVGECRPFMVLENVIVKSNCRGLGVGKKLVKFIEDYSRERKCYYIIFVSSADRKEAHRFYQSLGYDINAVQGFKKYLQY